MVYSFSLEVVVQLNGRKDTYCPQRFQVRDYWLKNDN